MFWMPAKKADMAAMKTTPWIYECSATWRHVDWHSRITATKSPAFLHDNLQREPRKTYRAPASVEWRHILGLESTLASPPLWLQKHTTSRILSNCDINLGSLIFLAIEAGDCVALILLYIGITVMKCFATCIWNGPEARTTKSSGDYNRNLHGCENLKYREVRCVQRGMKQTGNKFQNYIMRNQRDTRRRWQRIFKLTTSQSC